MKDKKALKVNLEVLSCHFTWMFGYDIYRASWLSDSVLQLFYQSVWLAYCLTRSIENTGEFEASWVNSFSMSINPSFHKQKNVCLQNYLMSFFFFLCVCVDKKLSNCFSNTENSANSLLQLSLSSVYTEMEISRMEIST